MQLFRYKEGHFETDIFCLISWVRFTGNYGNFLSFPCKSPTLNKKIRKVYLNKTQFEFLFLKYLSYFNVYWDNLKFI